MKRKIKIYLVEMKSTEIKFTLDIDINLNINMLKILNKKGNNLIKENFILEKNKEEYILKLKNREEFFFYISTEEFISNPIYIYFNVKVYNEEFFLLDVIAPLEEVSEGLAFKKIEAIDSYNKLVSENISLEREIYEDGLIYEIIDENNEFFKINLLLENLEGTYNIKVSRGDG